MLKSGTYLACCLLLAAAGASAEPSEKTEHDWLGKMVAAAHQKDYSGTFIYQSGSYIETSRISHLFDGENEHERLEGLDGERSEIIRKNGKVWCYLGDGKVMVAKRDGMRTFPSLLPEQFDLLLENYVIQQGHEERVAGFNARSILFHPKDKLRYTHRMWAQSDTGLLLKAVVLDEHEHVIEQYAFTQLNIGGNMDRSWIVPNKTPDSNLPEAQPDNPVKLAPQTSGWVVYAMPAGFKKMAEVTRTVRDNHTQVTHLVFSDGLAGISIFIEKLGEKPGIKTGLYSKGVIQIYSKVLDGNLLTVVGEVPARTVMQVADSVRYGGQQ
jgi:sigma-E factor negative regulatory protein RseB